MDADKAPADPGVGLKPGKKPRIVLSEADDQKIAALYHDGGTTTSIGLAFGIDSSRVWKVLHRLDIKLRVKQGDPERDASILRAHAAGASPELIARSVGMSGLGVQKALHRLGIFQDSVAKERERRIAAKAARGAIRKKVPERDREMVALHKQGKSNSEIATVVGMSELGVKSALRRLGLTPVPQRRIVPGRDQEIIAFAEKKAEIPEIMDATGLTYHGVCSALHRLGFSSPAKDRFDRDLEIVSLFEKGVEKSEIAVAVGVTSHGVYQALRRLGMIDPNANKKRIRQRTEREELIAKNCAEGKNAPEIARLVGMSRQGVSLALARLGLKPVRKVKKR